MTIDCVFENLEASQLGRDAVEDKLRRVLPLLEEKGARTIAVHLSTEHSVLPDEPDIFHVKASLVGGSMGGTEMSTHAASLYAALDALAAQLESWCQQSTPIANTR